MPFIKNEKPIYHVVHVDTEGGPFIAGGNGVYINSLMKIESKSLLSTKHRIALILPAYRPHGQSFASTNMEKISFQASIYKINGEKDNVELTVWRERKKNIDYFYLEPDENHPDYFTTQATPEGEIAGIRTIPLDLTPIQNEKKASISTLEKNLYHNKEDSLFTLRKKLLCRDYSDITRADLQNYVDKRLYLQSCYDELNKIFVGLTDEVSLYMRNAHFHELSGAFIDYLLEKSTIRIVHTHDYGNTAQHITKPVAKINTFHSDPGQGIFPHYMSKKLGVGATQRGYAMSKHHQVYAVSEAYTQLLSKSQYSNSHYTAPMASRGRISCVTSIADKGSHGLHRMLPDIAGYKTAKEFNAMNVQEKKQLAKEILADRLKSMNPNFEFSAEKKTLLFLSRISPAKGSAFIEDIIKFALKNDCNVLICGFHGYEGSEKLIAHLRSLYPQVPFIIGKEEQEKLGCLHRAASDIGIGVSTEEAFGLSYSECLCYGAICVVSDVGGTRSAVLNDNSCGILFPLYKGNSKRFTELQEKLCKVKNELQDCYDKKNSMIGGKEISTPINIDAEITRLEKEKNKIEQEINEDFVLDMPEVKNCILEIRECLISVLQKMKNNLEKNPQYDWIQDIKDLAECESYLQDIENKINSLTKIDEPRTREGLEEGMQKALGLTKLVPEIAERICRKAQKYFKEILWYKSIEDKRKTAVCIHNSMQTFASSDFAMSLFQKAKRIRPDVPAISANALTG